MKRILSPLLPILLLSGIGLSGSPSENEVRDEFADLETNAEESYPEARCEKGPRLQGESEGLNDAGNCESNSELEAGR